VEAIAGLMVAFIPKSLVLAVANVVTEGELSNDPDDPVASTIRDAAHSFSIHSHVLLSLYLFLHGIVKLVLVSMIFMHKKGAYPLFMVALILFSSYEAFRGVVRTDYLLIAFSIFDFSLFLITAYQYRKVLKGEVAA
jgi:uncharacterized membrane protein